MATKPIEEAVTPANAGAVTENTGGQTGNVNSANDDIFKNEGVIAGGNLMFGKSTEWHGADDAGKEKLSGQTIDIANQLNNKFGLGLHRGNDGAWYIEDGRKFYDVLGLTNNGAVSGTVNASGGGTTASGNISGAVGGTNTGGTSGTSGTETPAVAGVVGATTKGGYINDRGQYVITDKVAYNLISEAKNESQRWYTMTPEERQASHEANRARMDEVSRRTGRNIIYNEAEGAYYWENGEKVYDSLFDLEKSNFPEYQDKSSQIIETYDTALSNQLSANEEARKWQEYLLRANVDKMEKEYDAMARQSYADTARQLENEKLRQALNGERGGVGERQFGIYQSAGSERLYNIELERQKLRSDAEAQIAQLQAEGRIADAQLVAEFAFKKDEALRAEADKVYQADVNTVTYNDSRDDKAFEQTRILNAEEEEKRNNEFNRNITESQLKLSWANFKQAKEEHKDDVMFEWIDRYFTAQQIENDSRQRLFANALAVLPYDGGATLEATFGIKVQDPNVLEYYKYAFQAAVDVLQKRGDRSLLDTVMSDMYDCLIKGGKAVITDDGKFTGMFQMPGGGTYDFGKVGKFIKDYLHIDVENIFSDTNDDGGIDIDEEYTQGGNNDTGGNTGGNEGGNENGNGGNEDTSQNTSQNTSDDGGIDLPSDDGGIDIDKATETNEKFVNTNRDGKPETSTLDIMQGINTLKGKESKYNFNDPKQVEEYIKSNEYLINSLNVTYKLGITFDYGKKAYVYPDGTKVTDTVLTSAQNSVDDSTPKNIWKQDGGNNSNSNTNPNRVNGVLSVKSGQLNNYNQNNYKLGVDADSSGVAKNIPDSAEYLKDGVGNIVTTRTVDSEYLKKHPGTFAVDNGNGTYSYISIKMPDFTIEKTTKGGGFGYNKIGLDGTNLGRASEDDLKAWFTWDASVANPDKYAVGSFEREMALRAMYPNYGITSNYSASGGDDTTGNRSGTSNRSGGGGYEPPPETPPEDKPKQNQWLMSVAQGTKTFEEWLATDGKIFANDNRTMQFGIYDEYVKRIATEAGLSLDEAKEFRRIIDDKNS